ncbi:MAG: NUDIX domain-containing protein [Hyphomicrobiaceae bacterium]|nr:NUDIX domain-containing protein [Hyphomicrobiaceae bacterium]
MPQTLRAVSCAIVVGTCGRLLLQQRDDVPGIIHPGLIGLFGGHRDPGEGALDCVLRELEEEIGERIAPERAEPFLTLVTTLEEPNVVVDLTLYVVRGIELGRLVVTEGQPLVTDIAALGPLYGRMTPAAAFAVRQYELRHLAGGHGASRQGVQAQQQ